MIIIQQNQWQEKGLAPEHQIALLLSELHSQLQNNQPENIEIQISVGVEILNEITKVKALQMLAENLCKLYYPNQSLLPSFVGIANTRYYCSNEPELNLIRQSLQCFILQNCGIHKIEISSFNQQEESKVISQNINTLLQEESKFKSQFNSIAGATFIENRIDELAQKSWKILQNIENEGGFEAIVKSNKVKEWNDTFHQQEILLYKEKKKVLVGVNKYQVKENAKSYLIEKEL